MSCVLLKVRSCMNMKWMDPNSDEEAMLNENFKEWKETIKNVIDVLNENDTWVEETNSLGTRVIECY